MSEETIRAMEGNELTHVQARIQCLRNVRTLLDASMTQMQQYMNIVLTQRFLFEDTSVLHSVCFLCTSNMENGARLLSNLNNDVDQLLQSSSQMHAATTNSKCFLSPWLTIISLEYSDLFNQVMKTEEATDGTDADLLRRRRLAHYESKANSSPSPKEDHSIEDS